MNQPSFTTTIAALRTINPEFPRVQPTPEEAEVGDLLDEIQTLHVGPNPDPDDRGYYGACTGCLEPWPCAAWRYGEQLAVQWLGRAADRVYARATNRETAA